MLRVHCAVLNARPHRSPTGGVSTCSQRYGGHGERETPGLIPNPEAKPLSADGTALETGWESRTPPDNHSTTGPHQSGGGPSSYPPPGPYRDKAQPPAPRLASFSAIKLGWASRDHAADAGVGRRRDRGERG